MKELIDKSEVVAEIIKIYDRNRSNGYIDVCNEIDEILSFLDTLEIKEVGFGKELDFNAEVSQFIDTFYKNAKIGHKLMIRRTARYFYELGLQAAKYED